MQHDKTPIAALHLIYMLASLLAFLPASAQKLQATLSHYSTNDGLPSNAIADMKQDSYGYIWVATWNGLSRFDGFNFTNYATGSASGLPMMHNRISSLAIDSEQNVWMRMYDGRIFALNRKTDTIVNPLEGADGYEDMFTSSCLVPLSHGGVMAIIDGKGLYKLMLSNGKSIVQRTDTKGLNVTALAESKSGRLWIGTEKGLYFMDGNVAIGKKPAIAAESINSIYVDGETAYAGTMSGKIMAVESGAGTARTVCETGSPILSMFADSHGQLWFAHETAGINRIDLRSGDQKHYEQRLHIQKEDSHGAVVSEVDGRVWVSMSCGGFGYYDNESDEIEYFHNDPAMTWSLSNTVIAYIVQPGGVIFESTSRKGIERLDLLNKTIERILPFGNGEETAVNNIRTLFYDKEQRLLLVGGKAGKIGMIADGQKQCSATIGEQMGRIYGIFKDHGGNYWISTKGNGLLKMSKQAAGGYTTETFRHNAADRMSLSSDNVYGAVEDNDGNIWIATYDGGVNIMVKKRNGGYAFLNNRNAMKHYPKKQFLKVRTLALDRQGNVWAGTTDGLLVMAYHDNKIRIERIDERAGRRQGLNSNDILCLACDSKGTMWIGTNGGGISRCDGRNERGILAFRSYGNASGVTSDEIKAITFDQNGGVWLATDHSICSFDVDKEIFSTFSVQDGVDDTSLSEGAAITLPSGEMLFGTTNGIYIVDKRRLAKLDGMALKLRITDFMLNDKTISPRNDDHYNYYVPDSMRLKLPDHGSLFSLRFASLNYKAQARVRYQYMLDGYDSDWRTADATRTATYSGVPTGTYRLRVKVFLPSSPESFDMRTVEVVVPPPYMLSTRAVWIYILLFVAVSLLLIRLRQEWLTRLAKMRVLKIGPQEIAFDRKDDYTFVKRQLDWLEKHYSDTDLKIDDMAAESGLSRTMFYNELKSLTGLSPKEFVSDFRMKKAKMLLEKTNRTVAEITYSCGFNDPAYFSRTFKLDTGMSPSKYRETAARKPKAK